ncbi:hypothetical protein [Helicobacter pylori]|uniref:hypothetical protein n=1 Tax=Helicobacter pylori TaxID=210 RepID=UPI00165C51AE|nr:hypothetical protein [Helicobacter pylori]MBH0236142.1 hypothetical protein [Helicobacter pylori]MBH0250934.1 hypothetical protein [Helicobacter pylori]MBH0270003.1 hypothetical protein [Helicobacter pylori]
MFFKTYQKLLGAICFALYLVGCGNSGGGESPVEMSVNSKGEFQISSRVDSVTIQGVKLNRGNCVVRFSQVYAQSISVQDFKDEASEYEYIKDKKRLADMQNKISQLEQKGVMMEPQTLKFGESLKGISRGCNIIEAEIQTDKGTWTFNFNR